MKEENTKRNSIWSLITITVAAIGVLVFIFLLTKYYTSPTDSSNKNETNTPTTPEIEIPSVQTPSVVFEISRKIEQNDSQRIYEINLIPDQGQVILAVDIDINYDPDVITLTKIEPGDLFNSPIVFSKTVNQTEGKIFYATGTTNPAPKISKSTVAILTFTVHNNGEDKISLGDKTTVSIKDADSVRVTLPR